MLQSKIFKICMLLLTATLASLANSNVNDEAIGSVLDRVDPLIWKAAENSLVMSDKSTFTLKYIMVEPCRHLTRFGYYTWDSLSECENVFRDSFEALLDDMQASLHTASDANPNVHTISKRSPLPFICGYFVGDFMTNVKNWIFGEPSAADAIRDVNIRLDKTELLANALKDGAIKLADKFLKIQSDTPHFVIYTAHAIAQQRSTEDKLKRIAIGLKHGCVDIGAIRELTGGWPYNIRIENTKPIRVTTKFIFRESAEILSEFVADTLDPHTQVYALEGFQHWANITGTPLYKEYHGPLLALYNHSNNCAKGLYKSVGVRVYETCEEQNFVDQRLKDGWNTKLEDKNPFEHQQRTQVIDSFPYNVVYCLTRRITFRNKTFDCPPYPFRIRIDQKFSTDDYTYTPKFSEHVVQESINKTFVTPSSVEDTNVIREALEASRKLFEAKDRNEELEKSQVAFNFPYSTSSLTYKGLSVVLTILSSTVGIAVIYGIYLNEMRHKSHERDQKARHASMRRNIRRIHKAVAPQSPLTESEEEGGEVVRETSVKFADWD